MFIPVSRRADVSGSVFVANEHIVGEKDALSARCC